MHDVPAGETWIGVPAKPARQFFREMAWLAKAASRKDAGGQG
jgi:UDP-3-O-[3-hydroxymyristoyl] glucosamine N-acyltransferase